MATNKDYIKNDDLLFENPVSMQMSENNDKHKLQSLAIDKKSLSSFIGSPYFSSIQM